VRGIPMKTDPSAMAEKLLAGGDSGSALKRVKEELAHARRARSRHRYSYWAAVETALRAEPTEARAPSLCDDHIGAS
jgi:hypothetical protein